MNNAAAWVMNVGEGLYVAVSRAELVHILDSPYCVRIPQAPAYCNHTAIWNDALLPIMDISYLLGHTTGSHVRDVVAVTIFKDKQGEHHYGGIRQAAPPELEYVTNDQICTPPVHLDRLAPASVSWFLSQDGHPVPILDVANLFSLQCAKTFSYQ